MDEVEYYSAPRVSVIFDARHFPVLFVTWFGHIDQEAARAVLGWIGRMLAWAAEEDARIVFISDATRLANKPGPEVREFYARTLDELDQRYPGRMLGAVGIVESAIVRGAVAMILWLLRRKVRLTTVGSMASAIERARSLLEGAGVPAPAGLDPRGYERPLLPDEELDAGASG